MRSHLADGRRATTRVVFPIFGFTCGATEAPLVQRCLSRSRGVVHAFVSPATEMAYVEYDPTVTDPTSLSKTICDVGLRAGEPELR